MGTVLWLFCYSSHAMSSNDGGTWKETLQARELDGDVTNGPEAFYDTELNITWLRSAATIVTVWMPPWSPTIGPRSMEWEDAKSWAEQERYGLTGWRLPTTYDKGAPGCNYSDGGSDCGNNPDSSADTGSEMAHLFYATLGNKSPFVYGTTLPQEPIEAMNIGDFEYLQPSEYWSGTKYALDDEGAWYFDFRRGFQHWDTKGHNYSALAVRSGDIVSVPEPPMVSLVLAGFCAVAVLVRRRRVHCP